ncbi:MAG: methyltransferase domain-containing protein [Candidatus Riflebacteria bacterium]|nr:methyltransferase domain-containing protein [Candidatus Riflebacteria bacterium]
MSAAAPDRLKQQYRSTFKDRRRVLQEDSVRADLYEARYATVMEVLSEYASPGQGLVLDAGCGDGVLLERLLASGHRAAGLDISRSSLTFLRQGTTAAKDAALVEGDLECLPFASESLRTLTCLEALEHLADVEAALREFHRVLEPGGLLVATVPSVLNPRNLAIVGGRSTMFGSLVSGALKVAGSFGEGSILHPWADASGVSFPHKYFWPWRIRRDLTRAGFRIVRIERTQFTIYRRIGRKLERLLNLCTGRRLGDLLVVCGVRE